MTAQNPSIETLLSAVTDALLVGDEHLDTVIARYGVGRGEIEQLIRLIGRLHVVFVGVRPSRRFALRLKQDLLGQRMGVVGRVRHLPPRVQLVAIAAIVAGFIVLAGRHLLSDESGEMMEKPAAS